MTRLLTVIPARRLLRISALISLAVCFNAMRTGAQEPPYFITYSHHLEEPGNLEIEANSSFATQNPGNNYIAPWVEFEYGVKTWWTSEFYLDSQSTFNDSTAFTGVRFENRFRPLMTEHWINPVLYVEYEDITGADKAMIDVVGADAQSDYAVPNAEAQREKLHEVETKLILSGDPKGWNYSLNYIGEENLAHAPWEFGYALGLSRPLRLAVTPEPCNFCRENFLMGIEMYGGLGTASAFSLSRTSHYLAAIGAWQLPSGATFRVSPGFGLNGNSHTFVLRWSVSYEIEGFGRKLRNLF
ncbi:MAG TPA: hypothetical protein VJR04_15235 [Terriglobales bacterium]|nr:hypothetical protein [Terriglobales bacterium]